MQRMKTLNDLHQGKQTELETVHADIFGKGVIRVAWDCDPGNDDYTTYVSGAGKENIEFIMISASAGNVNQLLTLNNTLFMVEKAGLTTPVYRGESHPVGVPEEEMHNAGAAHGSSGLGTQLSENEVATEIRNTKPMGLPARVKFAELMHHADQPFTLLMTGALTTFARSLFELQHMLEKDAHDNSQQTQHRNKLIDEIFNATSRDANELSEEAKEYLNGNHNLSDLITPETRAFLQTKINEGKIQSLVMMGGVFPETAESIESAKLDYVIRNIGPDGEYHHNPQEIHQPGYEPQFASPSDGKSPEYGWHANQPIFGPDGTPLKPHNKIGEFNFAHDPVAARMVFTLFNEIEQNRKQNDKQFNILLVPLNTSHKILAGEHNVGIPLREADKTMKQELQLSKEQASVPSLSEWTARVLGGTGDPYVRRTGYYIDESGKRYKRQMIHDALTVGAMGRPELYTYTRATVNIDHPGDGNFPPNKGRSSLGDNPEGNVMVLDIPKERRQLVVEDLVTSTLVASRKALLKEKKIYDALAVLNNEIQKFNDSSSHVKHGMYANQKPAPVRMMNEIMQDIHIGKITLATGLNKLIVLAKDHEPIKHAAKKLQNIVGRTEVKTEDRPAIKLK